MSALKSNVPTIVEEDELRQRILRLSDEQLLEMVTTKRAAYRQFALYLASTELTKRGISYAPPAAVQSSGTGQVTTTATAATAAPLNEKNEYGFLDFVFDCVLVVICIWCAQQIDATPSRWGTIFEELLKSLVTLLVYYAAWQIHKWWRRKVTD